MFRKLMLGLATASMAATPMIAAEASAQARRTVTTVQHYGPHGGYTERTVRRQGAYRAPTYRSWHRGDRFDRRYARNYRQIDYRTYRGRGLYAPPRGYQWVQSGNDAVLVALAGGLIGAVIGGAIR